MDYPIPVTQKAVLKSLTDDTEVEVHFNPASLVYTIENSSKQQAADPKRRQFAAQFSGKLTMDLQFDTTDTGEDVRQTTNQVAMFMQASADAGKNPSSGNAQAQPVVSFEWGSYEFKGTMESFKETIDFFSADGVPLRALVSIGLARQDDVFDQNANFSSSDTSGSLVPTSSDGSATSIATLGGDPSAARQLGTDNGLESLRFTAGASLNVGAGIQLNAAASFSASASVSASAGLSIGGGVGVSVGGSAGISAGGSVGVSFGAGAGVASSASLQISAGVGGGALFGGQASAGVPATAGAFAGLETGRATVSTTTRLNPLRMLPATTGADVSTGANASFSLGGAANAGPGFSSDVGTSFNFNDRLVFNSQ
jgi:Contractile injection system tube protein